MIVSTSVAQDAEAGSLDVAWIIVGAIRIIDRVDITEFYDLQPGLFIILHILTSVKLYSPIIGHAGKLDRSDACAAAFTSAAACNDIIRKLN